MADLDTHLRTLARSNYWQSLYSASKKNNISLFENTSNFSGIQIKFLYWIQIYSMLYEELSTYEDKHLTEKVLESNFRTDCYLIYRNKKHEFLWKKHRQEEEEAKIKANRKKNFKHPGKESFINVDLRRES